MKKVLVEGGLTLRVETSSVPLLALDTQILIALGREAASPGSGDVRAIEFFNVAQDKVSTGKLLCFETNQREEYLGSNDSAAIAKASLALTRGVRCRHSHDVFKAELEIGMRAFLSGGMEIAMIPNRHGLRAVCRTSWWIVPPGPELQSLARAFIASAFFFSRRSA